MTDAGAWLALRQPLPPSDLAERLARITWRGDALVDALAAAGRDSLDAARGSPGRVRESAFRLLEADALLTYACEAALETEDPREVLRGILAGVGSGS